MRKGDAFMANTNNGIDMGPYESEQAVADPQNNEEVYLGSFSSILRNNLGRYVICEFLIGTNNIVQKEGILYSGGINFITLYQPAEEQYIVCDLYSLKFVTFIDTQRSPRRGVTESENPYVQVTPEGLTPVAPNPSNRGIPGNMRIPNAPPMSNG